MISIMLVHHYVINRFIMFTRHVFTVTAPKDPRSWRASKKRERHLYSIVLTDGEWGSGSVIISPSVNRIK